MGFDRIPDKVISGKPFSKWELVVRDSYDLKELYTRLHDYLNDEGFTDLRTGGDNYETYYREKDNGDGSKEHKIWWRASKYPRVDQNKNIKFYILLDMKTVMMTKKEVIINGQKQKLDNGELEFKFNLFIDFANNTALNDDFNNHWLLRYFKQKFFNKWNRVPRDQAFAEAMVYSNGIYSLIQTYTGVKQKDSGAPRDYVAGRDVALK